MSAFSQRFREVVRKSGLSQTRIAAIAGVSKSTVTSWMSGSSPRDFGSIKTVCDKTGVSFCWLLTGELEAGASVGQAFDAEALFEGVVRVKIERLVPSIDSAESAQDLPFRKR